MRCHSCLHDFNWSGSSGPLHRDLCDGPTTRLREHYTVANIPDETFGIVYRKHKEEKKTIKIRYTERVVSNIKKHKKQYYDRPTRQVQTARCGKTTGVAPARTVVSNQKTRR